MAGKLLAIVQTIIQTLYTREFYGYSTLYHQTVLPTIFQRLICLSYGVLYYTKCWQGKTLANIVNTFKYNRILTQFAKVFPSKCTVRVILPKYHPVNIMCYTVLYICSNIRSTASYIHVSFHLQRNAGNTHLSTRYNRS